MLASLKSGDINFDAAADMHLHLGEIALGQLRVQRVGNGGRPAPVERLPMTGGKQRRIEVVQQGHTRDYIRNGVGVLPNCGSLKTNAKQVFKAARPGLSKAR